MDANGTTHAYQGQSYGEQTYWFNTCLTAGRTIDLTVSGRLLAKPASRLGRTDESPQVRRYFTAGPHFHKPK